MTEAEELEVYKQKRQEWILALAPGDRNSIFDQIGRLLWNAAVFNVVNEARAKAPLDENGNTQLNPMFHHFVDECYFQSQFMAVRRLVDGYSLQGKKGVWSLCALLEDIKQHHDLLTRKKIICSQFEEYDPEVIKTKHREWMVLQAQKGVELGWTPRALDERPLESRHRDVDELCGVEKSSRKENNKILPEVLKEQVDRLKKVTQKIEQFADKYIAHSATKLSRDHENASEINVTLEELNDAYKVICQVGMFISNKIIGDPHSFVLPHPQFDVLEYIDRPLINATQIAEFENIWQKFEANTETWGCEGGS